MVKKKKEIPYNKQYNKTDLLGLNVKSNSS